MDGTTAKMAQYIREKGVSVLRIAEKTGLPYKAIYPSLSPIPTRKLRADEFMRICAFLEVDPEKFRASERS